VPGWAAWPHSTPRNSWPAMAERGEGRAILR
jgi:hypothetical protein